MITLPTEARESASLHKSQDEHDQAMVRGVHICLGACLAGILVGMVCAAMGWTL